MVQFVEYLSELLGGRSEAFDVTVRFMREGLGAFGMAGGETREFLRRRALQLGLLDETGNPKPVMSAELIRVAAVAREVPIRAARPSHPSLVYTVPEDAGSLVAPGQRLSYLMEDLIRMSRQTLRIGGPFWNESGFDQLLPVLRPAIGERRVACAFYVHAWETVQDRSRIADLIAQIGSPPQVRILWYYGPSRSLLHAKFVIADGGRGLLSTANLTSWGPGHHVEIGIPLTATQCQDLERFLDGLAALNLLRESNMMLE
jgi:hypothetical protein